MDLSSYRNSPSEIARIADLMRLLPNGRESVLDIGARDGYIAMKMTSRFEQVTALDLEMPEIAHDRVHCVKGDITSLSFSDSSFDVVLCAEVLEHIPSQHLEKACRELARVARGHVLIGVPYRQDIRHGRTTCSKCGQANPPWGHVNSFDESRLRTLFPKLLVNGTSFVGKTNHKTNFLSTALMDFAGNPYGTYSQEEPCIHCGEKIGAPAERSYLQKVATKLAFLARQVQQPFVSTRPNWIHVLMQKV